MFYKCTDAKGNTSLQNGTPCAPGMKQEIRRIGSVRTVPVPAAKPKTEAPAEKPVYGEPDRVLVLEGGRIRFTGTVAAMNDNADLRKAYFGLK